MTMASKHLTLQFISSDVQSVRCFLSSSYKFFLQTSLVLKFGTQNTDFSILDLCVRLKNELILWHRCIRQLTVKYHETEDYELHQNTGPLSAIATDPMIHQCIQTPLYWFRQLRTGNRTKKTYVTHILQTAGFPCYSVSPATHKRDKNTDTILFIYIINHIYIYI